MLGLLPSFGDKLPAFIHNLTQPAWVGVKDNPSVDVTIHVTEKVFDRDLTSL
jgi:hypothetical protein